MTDREILKFGEILDSTGEDVSVLYYYNANLSYLFKPDGTPDIYLNPILKYYKDNQYILDYSEFKISGEAIDSYTSILIDYFKEEIARDNLILMLRNLGIVKVTLNDKLNGMVPPKLNGRDLIELEAYNKAVSQSESTEYGGIPERKLSKPEEYNKNLEKMKRIREQYPTPPPPSFNSGEFSLQLTPPPGQPPPPKRPSSIPGNINKLTKGYLSRQTNSFTNQLLGWTIALCCVLLMVIAFVWFKITLDQKEPITIKKNAFDQLYQSKPYII